MSGKSALLRALYRDPGVVLTSGFIGVRGRGINDWDTKSLKERTVYLKEEEERLHLPAGAQSVIALSM